jgi:CAAX protease family protein
MQHVLSVPQPWPSTLGFAIGGLVVLLAYSPLADRIATAWIAKPPTLGAFRALQKSRLKLIAGIVIAWVLGGFLEELVLRGIIVRATEAFLAERIPELAAIFIAICAAAAVAFVLHLYQGVRAAIIVTELSVLFGVLFVVSGYNLWAVILCHGLYDTVAFIRFANKSSKYSDLTAGDTPD